MHRVAALLGMTVAELGERMTLRELIDWMRYEQGPGNPPPLELDGLSGEQIDALTNANL